MLVASAFPVALKSGPYACLVRSAVEFTAELHDPAAQASVLMLEAAVTPVPPAITKPRSTQFMRYVLGPTNPAAPDFARRTYCHSRLVNTE